MYIEEIKDIPVDSYGDIRTLVRGISYQCPDDWEDVLDSLDEDSNLYLIKEPENPKDKLAIAAYLDDRRVGYVASSDNGKIWLYMTDEKMPCTFIERFDASFKISFENPRPLFEGMPFKEIYKDKFGVTEQPFPAFDIPFLSNPKDNRFEWFDDRVYIADLERAIPDFRRKLATRMIIIAGRKDSKGEYHYYLPFANNPIADVEDDIIKGIIDRYGFVIALPDVPMINTHGGILMDLHVTFLKYTNFMDFNSEHQSELVFSLVRDKDYKHQVAADNPSTSVRNDNNGGKQNNAMEEVDMFMQEPQSTPSYSKSDYILKNGEVATSSIDKSTFTEIDKIASELFSFVRQTLFPSMELFSYLKKHTPYHNQFYDFDQFETLIRVLVIKDLGRIYKGLNHSFNFDTAEGKPLFLYMEKDVGESSETSYEAFNEICNPKTRLEAATKMRKVIENLMKSFYEYDIAIWTDTDFIIHCVLKEVDNELAKRYMELMRQFASAVADANGELSANLPGGSPSTFNDFFPLFGVTLGNTTWKQIEDMGNKVEKYGSREGRCTRINNVHFWDSNGEGVFTSISWSFYDGSDFPLLWKSKGFSWENSYDEWIDVFKNLSFIITVKKQPTQSEYSGRNVLSAKFEALSSDGSLSFELDFNYRDNGSYTSSPNTLYSISVNFEKPCSQVQCHDVEEESYEINDSQEGGKHVSMDVIVPEEDDEDFDFCTYECRISDKEKIDIIMAYMKRYEEGKEPRPFLMIGRPLLGPTDLDIFYSLDGEIIFNFIFDEKIKSWIKEAGFVLGKVKTYKASVFFPEQLDVTLSVSKRKCGEILFKQASEEAMDYIDEYTNSQADYDVEKGIIDAVKKYISGDSATPYKVLIISQYGVGTCTTLNGEEIAIIVDDEIIELAEKNKGVFGYITKVDYDDDGDVWFNIRVSRSIPRLTLERDSETSDSANTKKDSSTTDKQNNHSTPTSISEKVFSKFISDNFGCDVFNAPNTSWEYDTTKTHGKDGEKYESYIFKKSISGNPKSKEIQAAAVIGVGVNFCMDIKMNKKEIIDFVYRYKKLFFPNYTLIKCKKEYGDEENLIYTKGISPALSILLSDMGVAYFMAFQTSFCNKAYIDKQKEKGKILTLK